MSARHYFGDQKWLQSPGVEQVLDACLSASMFNSMPNDPTTQVLQLSVYDAVSFLRLMSPDGIHVLDPTDPTKRTNSNRLGDRDLGIVLAAELRGTIQGRAQIVKPGNALPRNVITINEPTDNTPPQSSQPQSTYNQLDAAAAAFGINPQEYKPMTQIDLASLMKDPKKLGEFLATAVHTLNEVPKLTAQIADAKKAAEQAVERANASDKLANERLDAITDLEDRLKQALTKMSTGSVATPNQAGKGNDLKAIAAAMHITLDQLKSELDSFVQTCGLPLPNAVRWPHWCDPSDRNSPLPFCYRHRKPVFLAGESGTGKTFIAEALSKQEAGRVCSVTFHEKISYNKLFVRETVDNGKVRSVLGPILLSLLTGTPIVLDEIDHADIFVQSLMHEVLDKRRVFIPELAISIVAEDGCRFIATGNSLTDDSGQYHGDVGTALRTRFAAIHVEYPDEQIEAETIVTASGCDKNTGARIAQVFKALRHAVMEQKIAGPISVRESCAAGTMFVQAKQDKLTDDQALALGLGLMVVQKRPPQEQLVAAEICATVAKVHVGAFQNKVQQAGKRASAGKP